MPDNPNHLHLEILSPEQAEFLPVLKDFSGKFGLVGGTAVALFIGHRRSIDFDLFSAEEFGNLSILNKFKKFARIQVMLVSRLDEVTFVSEGVKFTFFRYPYPIRYQEKLNGIIKLPDLITLAAMKAFALSRRAKWKDYVDLYFVMKDFFSLKEIAQKAQDIFGPEFNEKIFRSQLAYFKDIDYTEKVIFMPGFDTPDEEIERKLVKLSIE